MSLDDILSSAGRTRSSRRRGRGTGSGRGKTCGRGHKGMGSRSGSVRRLGYQGGTNPALYRIPKRGFNNANFRVEYQIVNLAEIEARFEDGSRVDAPSLVQAGVINDTDKPVKVLANGELTKKITVAVAKCSAAAAEKIAKAGGTVEAEAEKATQ